MATSVVTSVVTCAVDGTHNGKKNLKWKDDADFRPLPPPMVVRK